MFYGRTGKDLIVDLSRGNIETEQSETDTLRDYVGGLGTCTKMFWDRVPPDIHPFSEKNALIFGAGLLTGTTAPGANRTILVTRSPQTNLMTYSAMGGFWAPELKKAGYDSLTIIGKSPVPIFLIIENNNIEIRDANHLWGKDVNTTQKMILEELGNKYFQTLCIGQAGENKVFSSNISHSTGACFSRCGVGALMGDKNLKAIAVYGTNDINIAHPIKFNQLCSKVLKKTEKVKKFVDDWPYEREKLMTMALYGNMEEFQTMENCADRHVDYLKMFNTRLLSCQNCGIRCKYSIKNEEGEYSFVKCLSWFVFMAAAKIQKFEFGIKCYNLCEKYGMDSLSAAYLMAFAIDLYQKKIITNDQTKGMKLEYGDPDVAFNLLEMIAKREGVGDILANGIYEAGKIIGNGAEDIAYHVKKLEIPPYPLNHPYINLVQSVCDRADMLKLISAVPQHYLQKTPEVKKEYINSKYWPYPEEFKELIWDEFDPTGADYDRVTKMVSYDKDLICLSDINGICIYWTGFWPYNPYILDDQVELMRYATGDEYDSDEIIKIAKRTSALLRAYNVMLGIERKDDAPPQYVFEQPTKPPVLPPLDKNIFEKTIDNFYELRGYNKKGIPSKKKLEELGLEYVNEQFKKRGIDNSINGDDL